jgi:folate-binding protein YgfZ
VPDEYAALTQTAGALDLSFRGRLCVTGTDRVRFLHGQVTNDVAGLQAGQGCYAALVTAKGKMVSDLNIYRLENELLLDFEPRLTDRVRQRLEQYVIADDVQVIGVEAEYGLLSVQGPRAREVLGHLELPLELPCKPMALVCAPTETFGEIYLANQARLASIGFDLFVPAAALTRFAQALLAAVHRESGRFCGWEALETARIEAGIPRFGADIDESNLPPEAGLEARAISYNKGCYMGQEIIARIRTYGQVARTLRGLRLPADLPCLPSRGDKLFKASQEVGYVTSAAASPALRANLALGYVRREANAPGTQLTLRTDTGESAVRVVTLPFEKNST